MGYEPKDKDNILRTFTIILTFCLSFYYSTSFAGEADVIKADFRQNNNSYNFSVTISHKDTGWKHYANRWEIISKDGTVLGTRVLHHPHVNEQPFTRSLSGVEIPENSKIVTIRAHDSVHKYGGRVITIKLP